MVSSKKPIKGPAGARTKGDHSQPESITRIISPEDRSQTTNRKSPTKSKETPYRSASG
jgi:hypothetical protein